MQITLDDPDSVAAPVGPYSHVARLESGDGVLLMLSGQIAVDAGGGLVGEGSMTEQARRVFEIIEGILAAHGAAFEHVVNIRTYLTDIGLLPEYGAVRRKYFTGPPPTSTTIEVSRLFRPGALLEVEVVAAVGEPAPA
ncbi:RidA family protein [Actinomadura sp. HBU206391]|uniref:RidA family protein n=1 Tax=Actinomadura sp. HBU206391 TaxID=2731692 RepID=UPI00164F0383|nr:RidA family protein [Actinomadura sp. HBU206391]MBC6459592.1 RidA family protein [Actinomadura sp. HBU206391]